MKESKIVLSQAEMPRKWYNIQADMPTPLDPPIHPGTGQPIGPEDLAAIFPMELIKQEVSQERYIDIPEEVLEAYTLWRPSPLQRARGLEKALDTPAHIYFKNESVSPAGSHKPNTAVAQAFYNMKAGITRIATETGPGSGAAPLAWLPACSGSKCTVYMVRISFDQKPYRKSMIQVWGAEINPSPSERTMAGKRFLAQDPDTPGTLGMAITEAVEDAATHEDTNYSLGSVLNHVCLHQTIVGEEAIKQMAIAGRDPGRGGGLHRGRLQLRGHRLPLYPREDQRQQGAHPGGGARLLPQRNQGRVRL
jgi:tryptophan synthase beta chain